MEKYMELDNMDAYYEQAVKRKMSSSTISALILSLVVIVVIMVLSIYLSFTVLTWFFPIALIMLGLGIYLIYYILKNSRVEYEYTFVLGELRIARIKGRAKRKNITYFDVKAIDDIGKYINPETGKKNIDASKYPNLLHAAVNDDNLETYYMVIHDKIRRKPAVLLFTPNDRTLEMIRPYLSVPLKKKFLLIKKEEEKIKKEIEAAMEEQEQVSDNEEKKSGDTEKKTDADKKSRE